MRKISKRQLLLILDKVFDDVTNFVKEENEKTSLIAKMLQKN